MVTPSTIHEYGNQLKIVMDDATSFMAYPTLGGLWIVSSVSGGGSTPSGDRFVWPFDLSTVTDEYGNRDPDPYHNGIDFGVAGGSIVKVMGAGTVTISQTWQGGTSGMDALGNYVRVDHGGGLLTGYAHMESSPPVSVGDVLVQQQNVGAVGDTGYSFGNHLHMETWENGTRINPRDWMNSYATT